MMLAGLPVADQDVLELARLIREAGFDETAETLESAWDVECKVCSPSPSLTARPFSERWKIRPTGWRNSAACSFESTSGACARGSSSGRIPSPRRRA
jgi:hypothetical protein